MFKQLAGIHASGQSANDLVMSVQKKQIQKQEEATRSFVVHFCSFDHSAGTSSFRPCAALASEAAACSCQYFPFSLSWGTPSPVSSIRPRLYCASMCPCCEACSNQYAAHSLFSATPVPERSRVPMRYWASV